MNLIKGLKLYVETLGRSKKYLIFSFITSFVFIAVTLYNYADFWSSPLIPLFYIGVQLIGTAILYPILKSEMEITRIRSLLTGEMRKMAQEIETRIAEIKKLWRQFSPRPIFCATELETTRQTVYRKFLLYQKQQAALNSLPANIDNDEVQDARRETEASVKRTLKYIEETEIRLNIVASQIGLLDADGDIEPNSLLLTTIESLKNSRKALNFAEMTESNQEIAPTNETI